MNFERYLLKEIAVIQTGPFGSQLHKEDYQDTGTPVVTVEHLGQKNFTTQNLPRISDEDLRRLNKYTLDVGDIVFSRVGSVDRCSYVSEPYDKWVFSGRCLRIRVNNDLLNPEYLYYYFCSNHIKKYIRSVAVGATMPSINTKIMGQIPVALPSREHQDWVVRVLSSFDDKIVNNSKIIRKLEDLLTSLFYEKCVKAQGHRTSLSQIAHFLNGLAMQKYPPETEDQALPVLKIKELRQAFCDSDSDLCSASINPQYIVNDGDLIFSWSGSLLVDIWTGGKCGLNQHLFKVTSKCYPKWFVYLWIKFHINNFISIAQAKATTMGHIKRSDLDKAEVVLPNNQELELLNKIFQPKLDLIVTLRLQNKTMVKIRDLLLPKLLSGEIE